MGTAPIRVLVVDDCRAWRDYVSATLQEQPEWQVVGEVSDGLEAIQQARELLPDLILMDIGLPTLNGIEAVRRIKALSSMAKILFTTENRSPDVVREALSTGATGYLLKSDSGSELLNAVRAVLEDQQFISRSVLIKIPE
jgi:DNA-binding NarL/FixJ family response regulator